MNAVALNRYTTAPNLLSLLRIVLTPVLLGLVLSADMRGFFWTLALAFGTDVLDGFLARRLGQVTALGATLDSIGDLAIATVMFYGVGCFFPDAIHQFGMLMAVGFVIFAALQAICFVRFRQPGMLHTWFGKASGVVGATAILSFFWTGHTNWLGYLACGLGIVAQVEQLGIALTLRTWQTDMVSWWHVLRAAPERRPSVS
ncbi:MAG TPA: CDP-alcohol phosphatidyltransferase family protein [Symbiobacteriaceae bacterium]|nr:CDP-alcohol phosphatidyltransferase family protein [Symbiobacteriaceae bacterium]